ncbi:MAG TPA: hypothetical protein VFU35_10270, partial [Jatrophihabitans sp.]|nr:hypothetical protein [Jatrophihabitans sp.]
MSLSFTLERADDGVSLTVTVDGMTVRETPQGAVLDRAGAATIAVEYPAQHIVEYADTVASQAPIQEAAIFARASRVVFSVPAGAAPIPLTVAGLLGTLPTLPLVGGSGSASLQQVVDPAAAVRAAASTAQRRQRAAAARAAADVGAVASRDADDAAPAAGDGTSLYVPSRLELAIPSGAARFVHAAAPVQRGDLVESWHSRFAVSTSGGPPVEITTSAVVRSTANYRTPPATTPANISYAKVVDEKKIASALDDAADDLRKQTGKTPLTMRRLALSPAGGSVDLEGTWSHADGTWPANEAEPSLAAYKHRVVLGRDVEIRKVLRGRLFPLGHAAILTETTRRVARTIDQGSAAALFTQSIITVRQPTKTYPQGDRIGRAWPWTQITITNPVSPPGVDEIETVFGTPEEEFHILKVDGEPFVSECRASDIGGNEVAFSLAQIFVPDGQNLALAAVLWRAFADPSSHFADRFGGFDLHGRTVLTAPAPPPATSPNADATSLHVSRVTLDRFATSVADFRPTVAQFLATSPAIDALHGPTSAVFTYAEPYLANAFGAGNAAELLMTVDAAAADFGGQAAGLVKAQTAPIRALSRSIGAVAAQAVPGKDVGQVLTDLAGGHFEPSAWFKLPAAKLFGVFGLEDVLARAGVTAHELASAPKQLVEIVEGTKKITVHWRTTLLAAGEEFPADGLPVTLGTADGKAMTLDLRSVTEVNLASQTARTTNRCTIENAALKIGPTPPAGQTHLVTLPIRSITFEATDSAAPDVDLQVGQVSFGGA